MDDFMDLRRELESYLPEKDVNDVTKAYEHAKAAHEGQMRQSGEPYISHPVAVSKILAELQMDKESIMAALLHDVIEDTQTSKEFLQDQFGEQVAELVDGVTKLTQIKFRSHAEAQAEDFRKMVMAMSRDIRVILVKLADRLHNMRTVDFLPPARQHRMARETLDIYAPIANRLGMHSMCIELEERGFKALNPMRERVLCDAVNKIRGDHQEIISDIKNAIEHQLQQSNLDGFSLWGREKHLYGIYKKMKYKHLAFSEVMDLYAFRIIVDSEDSCYRALGAIHRLYKPVPERFKDYIAIPKVNGYQSLHTTLFGPYGIPIEIQIRTAEMDRMADTGIAAHWLYKTDDDVKKLSSEKRTREWVKNLLEMQKSASPLEFIENVKIDLYPDEVYVFSPKGDIYELPAGATPVDFAYGVHSDIGNTCIATRIDRRLAPLSMPLSNGQTVEIITAPGARPNPAWMNFVVTGKARSNIRHYLKLMKCDESISLGKYLLAEALGRLSLSLDSIQESAIENVLQSTPHETFEDLLEHIGLGNEIALFVARRLAGLDEHPQEGTTPDLTKQPQGSPLSIRGSKGMSVTFAKCCYPIPGDPIVGVLRSGQGLVIHRDECKKLTSLLERHPEHCVAVRWEDQVEGEFQVKITTEVINRRGVLAALTAAISNAESGIDDILVEDRDEQYDIIKLILTVRDRRHLARVIRRIRQVPAVTRLIRER